MAPSPLRLLLGGDVLLGRGLDQCMASHCDPVLHEPYVRDARYYVELAERCHGPIATLMVAADPWGGGAAAAGGVAAGSTHRQF